MVENLPHVSRPLNTFSKRSQPGPTGSEISTPYVSSLAWEIENTTLFSFAGLVNKNSFVFVVVVLTFTTVSAYSADDTLVIFFIFFPQKTGFDISCK